MGRKIVGTRSCRLEVFMCSEGLMNQNKEKVW